MTDVDRLRTAARLFDCLFTGCGCANAKVAALLRAVADNHDNGTDRLSTTVTAAEALADVILGGAK